MTPLLLVGSGTTPRSSDQVLGRGALFIQDRSGFAVRTSIRAGELDEASEHGKVALHLLCNVKPEISVAMRKTAKAKLCACLPSFKAEQLIGSQSSLKGLYR